MAKRETFGIYIECAHCRMWQLKEIDPAIGYKDVRVEHKRGCIVDQHPWLQRAEFAHYEHIGYVAFEGGALPHVLYSVDVVDFDEVA